MKKEKKYELMDNGEYVNEDELRKEREIQKGIEKQEIQFDKQQYWEDIADNNPDDGSWIGR